jgi:lambda repressor-like predicted transcriptional regulator
MSHPTPDAIHPAGSRPRPTVRPVIEFPRPHAAALASVQSDRPLWDAASGRFNPVALRAAIVCRGWTVRDFAATAGISRACLYNVLRRHAASDRTAIRVAATLATRDPLYTLTAE